MPNKPSAEKRMRQDAKRRARNRENKSVMHTAIRKADDLIAQGDQEKSKPAVANALRVIGKTARKGVIHKRNAQRKQSRLMKRLNKLSRASQ